MAPPDINSVANGIHTPTSNSISSTTTTTPPETDYKIPLNDQYAFQPRRLRVITIGAGFSGLLIAHKFQHRFPEMQEYVDHTIFEGHSELGGTWLVNTYPLVLTIAVDVLFFGDCWEEQC